MVAAALAVLLTTAAPPAVHATPASVGSTARSDLPHGLGGRYWERVPTRAKVVALTFDAGGGAGAVTRILRTLKAHDIRATFFVTGHWARTFPAKVARIARAGHVLGNHTDTHAAVPGMSTARLREQLALTDRAVRAAAGRGTAPWFRFPFGAHRPTDITRVNDLGYAAIGWTVDTAGWMGTSGGQSTGTVTDRVLDGLRPGEIVLMHVGQHPTDGSTLDADALPGVIEALAARGYGFTTLEALLPPPPAGPGAASR